MISLRTLHLALLGCILTIHDSTSLRDVAVHTSASMSSQWGPRNAGNAVDGVLTFNHNLCSNTQLNDIQPWWKTDLQDVFRIEYIIVRNACKYSVQN